MNYFELDGIYPQFKDVMVSMRSKLKGLLPTVCGRVEELYPTNIERIHKVAKQLNGKIRRNAMTSFFVAMIPPTTTHQEKKIRVVNGKPVVYEPSELKAARAKLEAHLSRFAPDVAAETGVRLVVKWCFPLTGNRKNGEYRTTRPDTDNLQKLLKDVMTKLRFWKDDALVASEIAEKFWATIPGIYISIQKLDDGQIERGPSLLP